MTKPFSVRELISRVRANSGGTHAGRGRHRRRVLEGEGIELDVARHEVRVDGEAVAFPPRSSSCSRPSFAARIGS